MKKSIILMLLIAGLALPGLTHAVYGNNGGNGGNGQADWTCVSAATSAREDVIISAFDNFSSSVSAALKARKTALVAANGTTEKATRNEARKKAWEAFRKSRQNAVASYKTARKNAFSTFASTVKNTCRAATAATEEKETTAKADPVI